MGGTVELYWEYEGADPSKTTWEEVWSGFWTTTSVMDGPSYVTVSLSLVGGDNYGVTDGPYYISETYPILMSPSGEEMVIGAGEMCIRDRMGPPQPIQHIRADLPVSGIGAQGQHGQRRRLKGCVKGRLRESLHLSKAFGEGREGKGFPLVSNGCGCRRRGIHGGLL